MDHYHRSRDPDLRLILDFVLPKALEIIPGLFLCAEKDYPR
jgi:hypothetical protein